MAKSNITDRLIWVVTILALIFYSVAELYGMEFLADGNHVIAFGVSFLLSLILTLCVWEMCSSKSSRNKRRDLPLGILAAFFAIAILVVGSWPVTVFLNAYDNESELENLISNTRNYAVNVDSLYVQYANKRVYNYRRYLDSLKCDTKEKNQRVKSLERRLLSLTNDSIHHKRQEWLATLPKANVWNVSTAKNLHNVFLAAEKWIEEYKVVSSVIYNGENVEPFECENFTMSAYEEYNDFISLRRPNMRSILYSAFCVFLIFATYFFVRRPKSRFNSHR